MKPTLLWRLMSPLREMAIALRHGRVQLSSTKVSAALRHPLSSRKRKDYRYRHAQDLWTSEVPNHVLVRYSVSQLFQRGHGKRPRTAAQAGSYSTQPASFPLPSVSAIIPNFNHGRFLTERLRSIIAQRVPVLEIIILDDASTDDSRDIIARITANIPIPVKTAFNEANSGCVFTQWVKGISLARGDLIWICESDDSCDHRFLEVLVPYFHDQSVMLAFGRTDLIDEQGNVRVGIAQHMDAAAPGYWQIPRIESARTWFHGPFGIRNIIPNIGASLFRRQQIRDDLLRELASYKVCGDWFFYSQIAHGGRIVFAPAARAYFRQHVANTSATRFMEASAHEEHIRIALAIRGHYGTNRSTVRRMFKHIFGHYRSIFGKVAAEQFSIRHPIQGILAQEREIIHVLIITNALTGLRETAPSIIIANGLSRRGFDVSMLITECSRIDDKLRRLVAPEIPVFSQEIVKDMGLRRFLAEFGVDLINTHHVAADRWLHSFRGSVFVPYVVSDHGSYGKTPLSGGLSAWLLRNVDYWISHTESGFSTMINVSSATTLPCLARVVEIDSQGDLTFPGLPFKGTFMGAYEGIYEQILAGFGYKRGGMKNVR